MLTLERSSQDSVYSLFQLNKMTIQYSYTTEKYAQKWKLYENFDKGPAATPADMGIWDLRANMSSLHL